MAFTLTPNQAQLGQGKPAFSWPAQTGATGYQIFSARYNPYGMQQIMLANVNGTSFVDNTELPRNCLVWQYTVEALLPTGHTFSRPLLIGLFNECSSPFKLTATRTSGGVQLSWPSTNSGDKYAVIRYSSPQQTTAAVVPDLHVAVSGTSYTDTTALPNQSYNYIVFSYNPANKYGPDAMTNLVSVPADQISYLETPLTPIASTPGYQLWAWLALIVIVLLVIWLVVVSQKADKKRD